MSAILGFSSGLPLGLSGASLQTWLASKGIDLGLIGAFALVGLPYSFKFIWSPFLDRYSPPFLDQRRGWILIFQLGLMLAIAMMYFCDPYKSLGPMACLGFLIAFLSASQDIVMDAYRIEVLGKKNINSTSAIYMSGYRIATLFSGSFAFILADRFSWQIVYLTMAVTMLIGVFTILIAPPVGEHPEKTIQEAIVIPFKEFFSRRTALEVLCFLILYKIDFLISTTLMMPFFLSQNFSQTEVGLTASSLGLIATLFGTLTGGIWVKKIGLQKSLFLFGLVQGLSWIFMSLLAHFGHNYLLLGIVIGLENFFTGIITTVQCLFLTQLCHPKFAVSQYALMSSLISLFRALLAGNLGWIAKKVGWESYFIIAVVASLPSLVLLLRYPKWMNDVREEEPQLSKAG